MQSVTQSEMQRFAENEKVKQYIQKYVNEDYKVAIHADSAI